MAKSVDGLELPSAERQAARSRGTALIVDDNLGNRLILQALLNKLGFLTVLAADGAEAVEVFDPEQIGLVFMDVMMPVMDGYEATTRIKKACGRHFVPVIFLTAASDPSALAKCVDVGGDDFMVKPYQEELIDAKVRALERIRDLYIEVELQRRELQVMHAAAQHDEEIAERIFSDAIDRANVLLPAIKRQFQPAETFSGDLLLTAPRKGGGLNVLLGDFTGHGLAAAIGAMPVAQVFHALTYKGSGILELAKELNWRLNQILPTGMFMAGCLLMFSKNLRSVSVWNGGVPHVIVADGDSGKVRRFLRPAHIPLGIMADFSEDQFYDIVPLRRGDRLFAYSDGVVEAANAQGEMFGSERVRRAIEEEGSEGLGCAFERIIGSLQAFVGDLVLADDVTMIEVPCCDELAAEIQDIAYPRRYRSDPDAASTSIQKFRMEVYGSELRELDPVHTLITQINACRGREGDDENLFTIFSELVNNAVDHGLLGLDSEMKSDAQGFATYFEQRERLLNSLQPEDGEVFIDVTLTPEDDGVFVVEAVVYDSGIGFDTERVLARVMKSDAELGQAHGRGIKLLRHLTEEIRFSERGSEVYVKYFWG